MGPPIYRTPLTLPRWVLSWSRVGHEGIFDPLSGVN